MKPFKVAIDGPAGSGKSTISHKLARKLQWNHIDTGAMYRAVTLAAIRLGIDLGDEEAYDFLKTTKIRYEKNKVFLNGEDVTKLIRSKEVTNNVSLVSSFQSVRKRLVKLQQEAAIHSGNVIMDGRDIGTVVIKDADLKIFLTANVETRARRRLEESSDDSLGKVIEEINLRDQKDSSRKESPLRKADDAIEIDTTDMSVDQVVNNILNLINDKRGAGENNEWF